MIPPPPTAEQMKRRDDLRALNDCPGWQIMYDRMVERMKLAQSQVMKEPASAELRAVEAGIWRVLKSMIEYPDREIDYINSLEDRSKAE